DRPTARPGVADLDVAAAEPQQDVAEQVVPLLFDHRPFGLHDDFAVPYFPHVANLAGVEDDVNLPVVQKDDGEPGEGDRDRHGQIPGRVHPDVEPTQLPQDGVPPAQEGEQDGERDQADDDDDGDEPAEQDRAG